MPRRRSPQAHAEQLTDLVFPLEGVEETRAYSRQRSGTTPDAQNVRSFEPATGRARGGQRPGLKKYLSSTAVGAFPIQCLDHLVTNDVVASATDAIGQFVYALASGSGFGLGLAAGTNYFTGGVVASFAFACSCWDDSGNVYVAMKNNTSGACTIYKVATASGVGTLVSAFGTSGALTFVTLPANSNRTLAGMVVIGTNLYVAVGHTTTPLARIYKLNTSNGAAATGTRAAGLWADSSNTTGFGVMRFSTNSSNCLGRCGNILAIESFGSSSATAGLLLIDTAAASSADSTTAKPVLKATALYGGTQSAARSRVVSDGIAFFYVIASVTTAQVKKIGLGGVIEWSSAGAATATGLAYDFSAGALVACTGSTPSVNKLSLSTGAALSTADPGSKTDWTEVAGNNAGFFTLYRQAAASLDVMGINTTLSTIWGPSSFANTTHYGASVNQGKTVQNTDGGSRQTRGLVISNGECRRFDTTGGATAITNGASFATHIPVIWSAQNGTNMFFADGVVYKYYKSTTNAITAWTPTAGTMPVDTLTGRARLICTWRGRTVLAGLPRDPQNWFMSAQYDAFDWDYSPTITSVTQATSGDVSDAGFVGDFVNCLIPYTDDTMLFGCDHTIWQLTGDPMEGGRFDLVSDSIGMAWGRPFCRDPYGQIFFMSNQSGIYKLTPGALPVRVSQQIEKRIEAIDMDLNLVQLAWDLQRQGLWVFITPKAGGATVNFFWEERVNAWWPDVFANASHNPLAVHVYDGDLPDDRRLMLGGQDGYIRTVEDTSAKDDGTAVDSFVLLGPIMTRDFDEVKLVDLQATLGVNSGDITFSALIGRTPEEALAATPIQIGTWQAGRNRVSDIRRAAHFIYIKAECSAPWAFERVVARWKATGMVRRRN